MFIMAILCIFIELYEIAMLFGISPTIADDHHWRRLVMTANDLCWPLVAVGYSITYIPSADADVHLESTKIVMRAQDPPEGATSHLSPKYVASHTDSPCINEFPHE